MTVPTIYGDDWGMVQITVLYPHEILWKTDFKKTMENHGTSPFLMGKLWKAIANVYKKRWKITMMIGTLTISTGPFSSSLSGFTRG